MNRYPVVSFSSGELSPQIDARTDVEKYRSGCRILENMIPRIYGPAERRPGTKYIDTVNGAGRVIPFIYSSTIAYVVLLEDLAMYFYYNGGQVLDTWGRRLKIDTPYLEADLFELQYKQSNDVMWLVHNNYAPRKLTRTSANSFSLDEITFTNGPFKKRNDLANADSITMTPSVTTGSGTLTASSATFNSGHVGALFNVTQPRVLTEIDNAVTGVWISSSIPVEGAFTFTTHGVWTGTVVLQRSIDNSTWETYRKWTGENGDAQVQYTGTEEEDGIYYRINVTSMSANTGAYAGQTSKVRCTLTVNSSTQTGICRITGYTSSTLVSMTVLKTFASTNADVRWSEGCWSTYRGFPKCVTFFENRCVYAATTHQPQTVWLSATDDFEDFNECTKADSAFSLTMSSDTRNAIQWISGVESILVGTTGSEWRIWSDEGPLTPTSFNFKAQTERGSKAIQALPCGDVVLFVDFVGRKVRELTFDGAEKYKYVSPDLTALAEHITDSGITSMAFQRNPDPILWCTLTNGNLISMTYEREQNVIGWAKHPFIAGAHADSESLSSRSYPTLQELTSAEIPATPAEPADGLLVGATSVTDAAGLQAMAGAGHYSIDADIDLTGVTWTPIVDFNGKIEGNNHTITNLTITSALGAIEQGLIGNLKSNAEIRNLHFGNCTVTGSATSTSVGILAGNTNYRQTNIILKNITLTNCYVKGHDYVGCLIGYMEQVDTSYVYDCHAINCTVEGFPGGDGHGALIGGFYVRILDSGDYCYIIGCSSQGGTVQISANGMGGLIGQVWTSFATPLPTDALHSSGGIYDCYSSTDLSDSASALFVGGLVGSCQGFDIVSCYATGDITSTTYRQTDVGGLIGSVGVGFDAGCDITNCYSTGDITLTVGGRVGGFIGVVKSKWTNMTRCYSTGTITINGSVDDWYSIGGFVGEIENNYDSTIQRCWSTGDIIISQAVKRFEDYMGSVGGFSGLLIGDGTAIYTQTFLNCYSWGSITYEDNATDVYTGGFLGSYYTNPGDTAINIVQTNCYSAQTDSATGSSYVSQIPKGSFSNGFYGYNLSAPNSVTSTAIFWDTQTSDIFTDAHADGHPTVWMMTKDNYEAAGWDFDTIWTILDPVLWGDVSPGPNSVCVIPGSAEDEVWLVVARVINGILVRYLEQMQPRDWGDDDDDQWFVDAGLDYDGTADTTFSGLNHLEGEEVAILADGAIVTRQTVTNGAITLPDAASRIIVGLPFRYKLKSMRFDINTGASTTQTALRTFSEVVVSFYKTLSCEYGKDVDNLFKIDWRTTETYGEPPALYTGDKLLTPEGGFDASDSLILTGDEPVGCTVRAMIPRIEYSGR